jgi:P-type E1-E2 ATPase
VEDVKVGSLLIVKAGEIIPTNGEVVSGKSSVDENSVTGESMPIAKGDQSNFQIESRLFCFLEALD